MADKKTDYNGRVSLESSNQEDSGQVKNQNQGPNSKKQALGPNTRRKR